MCFGMFSALPLAPHSYLTHTAPEVGFMSMFMSSSTVKSLALASSLTLLAVSIRTVSEYQPFSGMDITLLNVNKRLTGQLFNWPVRRERNKVDDCFFLAIKNINETIERVRTELT
jgi:hypothetical protein